jgi:PEP-CTERM motif-containing protein
MAKLYRDSPRNRRRWILALLVAVLGATVSTFGPSQAVSGLTNASVAVMETFSAMLASEAPSRTTPAASTSGSSKWIDGALRPEFGQFGAGVIESAGGGESLSADPAIGGAPLAFAAQQFQLGSGGSGWGGGGAGGGGPRPGFSQHGGGGGGGGGSAGQLLAEFAGLDGMSSTRGYSFESGIALTNNAPVSFEPRTLRSTSNQPSGELGGGSGSSASATSDAPTGGTGAGLASPSSAPPGASSSAVAGGLGSPFSAPPGAPSGVVAGGLGSPSSAPPGASSSAVAGGLGSPFSAPRGASSSELGGVTGSAFFATSSGALSGGLGGGVGSATAGQTFGAPPIADGAVPELILAGLLDDVGVPNPALASGDSLATAAGGGGVFDLTQVPEPSTMILISLGVAATSRRRFQDFITRYL